MSRDWIITVLKGLPIWLWPIFLWDAARVGAWWQGLPIRADALLSVGVTKGGRIVVISVTEGDAPDPCDWTLEQVHPNASRFGIPIQDER